MLYPSLPVEQLTMLLLGRVIWHLKQMGGWWAGEALLIFLPTKRTSLPLLVEKHTNSPCLEMAFQFKAFRLQAHLCLKLILVCRFQLKADACIHLNSKIH